jgi:hypothetical protein
MNHHLCWSLIFLLVAGARADQPLRFEARSGVKAAELRSAYQHISIKDLRRQLSLQHGIYSQSCAFGEVHQFECFSFDWGITYLPPYPIALPGAVPPIPGPGNTPVRRWVPVDEVRDGARTFGEWERSVVSGTVFNCRGMTCSTLVQVLVPGQGIDESSYAVCTVVRIEGQNGAPESCEQIAVRMGTDIWLSAVTGSEYSQASVGRPEFAYRLRGGPPRYRAPSKSAIADELKKALHDAPLSFRVDGGQDSVTAVAAFRASPILNGWREIVTIEVLLKDLNETPPGVGLVLNATVVVNRQNTPRQEDFHLPNDQQQELYLWRLRSTIDAAIRNLCRSVVELDSNEFSCVQ